MWMKLPPPNMIPVRAFWLALVCSLSVYFIPLIGPHAAFFLWESLLQRFRDFGRNPAWAFTELGAALVLQTIALGMFGSGGGAAPCAWWFWESLRWQRSSKRRAYSSPVFPRCS